MEPVESASLIKSKKNMRLTRIFGMLAFASNATVNVLLIGYFARVGGIELVGQWAFLGAVMLAVMILDFGSLNALTYRIAKDELDSVACILRQLLRLAALTSAVLALGLAGAFQFADEIVQGSLLAGFAALLQLASSWLVSIRMGRQQRYWFNIKTIIRVMVQASAAVLLLQRGLPFPDIFVFGMALVLGGAGRIADGRASDLSGVQSARRWGVVCVDTCSGDWFQYSEYRTARVSTAFTTPHSTVPWGGYRGYIHCRPAYSGSCKPSFERSPAGIAAGLGEATWK